MLVRCAADELGPLTHELQAEVPAPGDRRIVRIEALAIIAHFDLPGVAERRAIWQLYGERFGVSVHAKRNAAADWRIANHLGRMRCTGVTGGITGRGADLLIIDDMGLKQLPKHAGEYLLEVIMRRYENRSTIMTSNRPLEEWGKLLNDVPTAGAILDRFLHHAQVIAITGKSYRVKEAPAVTQESKKTRKPNEPSTAGAAS